MSNKIEFTESAKKEIDRVVSEKSTKMYFRISVQGGGCSGFKYNFSFDDKVNSNDNIFNKTLIDTNSLKIIGFYNDICTFNHIGMQCDLF